MPQFPSRQRQPTGNVLTGNGGLADTETVTIIASGSTGRFQIESLHFDTSSTGPQMRLLIGGVVAAQTVAPSYTLDLAGIEVTDQSISITATGGTGDGNYVYTVNLL